MRPTQVKCIIYLFALSSLASLAVSTYSKGTHSLIRLQKPLQEQLLISRYSGMCRRVRAVRRGYAAARLLQLRVRIPSGEWMNVSCECCVRCQVEVSATGRSLVQRGPTECGVSKCDLETSTMMRFRPTRAVKPRKKEKVSFGVLSTFESFTFSIM
jgi:hypothetical protein